MHMYFKSLGTPIRVALRKAKRLQKTRRLGSRRSWRRGLLWRVRQSDVLDARRIRRTPRGNFRIVFEGVVDEAPFVRIHRLELKRTAGDAYSLRQLAHPLHDPIFAHGAIMFAIDD